eukprot:13922338-Alexandrium_andersonii.AAC.1
MAVGRVLPTLTAPQSQSHIARHYNRKRPTSQDTHGLVSKIHSCNRRSNRKRKRLQSQRRTRTL